MVGLGIILMTIYQNAFVAPIVKDQSDRGQFVVDTGLYGRVRHPMYLGFVLWAAGLALWLESTAGAIAAFAMLPALFARIWVEERTLRETLRGYPDKQYATRTGCSPRVLVRDRPRRVTGAHLSHRNGRLRQVAGRRETPVPRFAYELAASAADECRGAGRLTRCCS